MNADRLILGIESSCDDTAAAVVRGGREVLSSVVRSQAAEHAGWGGVVPEIAGRGHLTALLPTLQAAMTEARVKPQDLAAIAVTNRPGLLGSLLIGTTAAKALAWAWERPLLAVDHVQAHVYAALMPLAQPEFPCIALVVSGGHTALYRVDGPLDLTLLGSTRDDAAGEALDKAANLLGLGYPGGPAMEIAGAAGNPQAFPFKLPLLEPDSLEFSFSGLKTALLYTLVGPGNRRDAPWLLPRARLADLCASFEQAVAETLARKAVRAAEAQGVTRILVGGGVACNRRLRAVLDNLARRAGLEACFAPPAFCTDNAVMVAGLGDALFGAGRFAALDEDVLARAG
jgi:N6-L-threonylcarbamoyladenine synthase